MQDLLPNRFKGQISAIYWLLIGLIGFGFGSTSVALATQYLFHDPKLIRYSLVTVLAPGLVVAALCAFMARGSYQDARDRLGDGRIG